MAINAEHSRAYAVWVAAASQSFKTITRAQGPRHRIQICKIFDQRGPRGPAPGQPRPPAPPRSAPGPAPNTGFGFIGSRPSRCSFLRASLRARRTASAFSRAFFSEGFSLLARRLLLAENSLALHLLLQRLEGLIDIVIANENLHAASSFD